MKYINVIDIYKIFYSLCNENCVFLWFLLKCKILLLIKNNNFLNFDFFV